MKLTLFDDDAERELEARVVETEEPAAALEQVVASFEPSEVRAVGHRVVHGGVLYRESVEIDDEVATALEGLAGLAPLHNPPAIATIARARELLPTVPHVAVFDTGFFAELPPRAHVYPLPYEWHTDWGVRRFGFHGISHAYCAGRAQELLRGARQDLRIVVCHLGQGCSASAVRGGKAQATTMGFTPMEGLMMASRSGSVDPGILVHALRRGVGVEELDAALNRRSGLLGVSGVSSDYREVEAAAREGAERARLALEIYADRVRETVGGLAAILGGLDAIVFTAGVGENSASLRARVCDGLEFLGLKLDGARNESCQPDSDIATTDSPGRILVIHTRENLMIAREARRVALSSAP